MPAAHREPNPGHPITITAAAKRLRVMWNGKIVVDTTRALRPERGKLSGRALRPARRR